MNKEELINELKKLEKTPFLEKIDLIRIAEIRNALKEYGIIDQTEYFQKSKKVKFKKSKRVTPFSRNRT